MLRFGLPCTPANLIQVRQALEFHQRSDFNRSFASSRYATGNVYRFVEILRIHHEIAAQLFPCLGEWSVGYQSLAVANLDTGGGGYRLQGRRSQILTCGF